MRLPSLRSLLSVSLGLGLLQLGILLGQLISQPVAQAEPLGLAVQGTASPRVTLYGMYNVSSQAATIYTVPSDKDLIITDIYVDGAGYTNSYDVFTLSNGTTNTTIWTGAWAHRWTYSDWRPAVFHSETGLRVGKGTVLKVKTWSAIENVYTIVGYLAKP